MLRNFAKNYVINEIKDIYVVIFEQRNRGIWFSNNAVIDDSFVVVVDGLGGGVVVVV